MADELREVTIVFKGTERDKEVTCWLSQDEWGSLANDFVNQREIGLNTYAAQDKKSQPRRLMIRFSDVLYILWPIQPANFW